MVRHIHRVWLSVIDLFSNQDADELEWYVPSGIAISELQRIHNVIKQFLEAPIGLDGKKASQLLSKKRRRRRRRSPSPVSDDDAVLSGDEPRRRKEKKKKEKEQYKSAQFIEDSDEEYGDMDAFLEKEKAQREKTSLAAASAGARPPTMKATGTKKRRRKAEGKKASKSKKSNEDDRSPTSGNSRSPAYRDMVNSDGSDVETAEIERSAPMPRPRPRPLTKRRPSSPPPSSEPDERPISLSPPLSREDSMKPIQRTKRLILSDDDEWHMSGFCKNDGIAFSLVIATCIEFNIFSSTQEGQKHMNRGWFFIFKLKPSHYYLDDACFKYFILDHFWHKAHH